VTLTLPALLLFALSFWLLVCGACAGYQDECSGKHPEFRYASWLAYLGSLGAAALALALNG
jgi:hypothetical protein